VLEWYEIIRLSWALVYAVMIKSENKNI